MNLNSINYIVWLILSAVFFAFGEFLSKKFALNPSILLVVIIVVVYSVGVLLWLPAILQKNQLSIVGTLWAVLSLLATILIGIIIFSEKLTLLSIAGIIFAFLAVIFLSIN
jgi:multidrug transporter EmrE-like cation transporter